MSSLGKRQNGNNSLLASKNISVDPTFEMMNNVALMTPTSPSGKNWKLSREQLNI
jgi:hypothetical protein